MKKTGALLKAEREKLGVSLNEVSMSTKISVRVLTAIETGNQDDLPAKTFLRGFVQSYAAHLKMNTNSVLDIFHEEMGSTLVQPTEEEVEVLPETTEEAPKEEFSEAIKPFLDKLKESGLFSKLAYAAVFVLLVGLIFGVREIVLKYEKESVVEEPKNLVGLDKTENSENVETVGEEPAKEKVAATEDTQKKAEPATPQSEDKEKLGPLQKAAQAKTTEIDEPEISKPKADEVKEAQAKVAEQKPAEEVAKVDPKLETASEPKASEVAKTGQPAEEAPTPEKPQLEGNKPTSDASIGDNEVLIEAFDNVEIEFRVGSGKLQKISLGPDDVHTIKANRQIRIDFSDGGAVNITHNGRDRGVPGDLGKPKKVVLP